MPLNTLTNFSFSCIVMFKDFTIDDKSCQF